MHTDRRKFLKQTLSTAAGIAATTLHANFAGAAHSRRLVKEKTRVTEHKIKQSSVKFSVIGLNHGHIYGQTEAMIRGGGQLVSFYGKESDLAEAFAKRYPNAKRA